MSTIYDSFEPGIIIPEKTKDNKVILTFVCKTCKNKNLKGADGEFIKVRAIKGKTKINFYSKYAFRLSVYFDFKE